MLRRILLSAMVFAASWTQAAADPFTAKDMAMLDRASDPHVSPDGRFVAWNVRSTDWDENKGVHALWILDRQDKDAKPQLLASKEKSPTNPRWSDEGNRSISCPRAAARRRFGAWIPMALVSRR